MAMRKRPEQMYPNAAGIDVGASSHWVAVPPHLAEQAHCDTVRQFGPMTDDLNALADWLLAVGVEYVALESTGVYWIPVYEVLEQRGLKVWLVDARQLKRAGAAEVGCAGLPVDPTPDVAGAAARGDASRGGRARGTRREQLLGQRSTHQVDVGPLPRQGTKTRKEYEVRQMLANWAGVDLTRINGLGIGVVMTLLSEIGPDVSRFDTVKQFCSWLGLCPGTKISGGKVLSAATKRSINRARQALKLAAQTLSRSDSALGAFYRRLCARMDKPRANTAVAHKLARMAYFMLTRGEAYVDQGQERYEEQQRQRSLAALRRRASSLGFELIPTQTA